LHHRRSGFCYELNGAFAILLRHLGFDVTLMAARVATPIGLGPPFDHLVLRVDLADRWLVDVGFGRLIRRPVRWDERSAQRDVEGQVVLSDTPDGDLAVALNGEAQYVVEPRSRELSDFEPTCWWQQTSPESHFTQSLTCSLSTREGRVTLSGRRLIRTVAGERTEQELRSDEEVLAVYHSTFGITLDRVPVLTR
jgi:N-hydroxyarylamine O-acetyltransferase